jgi:LysR family glycine cleavage system transcriptional activator
MPVNSAINQISDTLELLRKDDLSGILTVSVLPSLAMKWLIPRLAEFNQKYPKIEVHIHADVKLTDFRTDIDDLAIRFGHQDEPELQATLLMPEDIFLVASPKLLKGKYPLKKISDIKHHTLLHDEIDCHFEAYGNLNVSEVDWAYFAKTLKVDISKNKNLIFTQAHLVLQAAVEAQGIAIGRSALAADDLRSGRLVKIYPDTAIKSPGYHIVYPKAYANRKKVQVFEKWLLSIV